MQKQNSNSTWQMIRNLAGEFFAVGLFICIVKFFWIEIQA